MRLATIAAIQSSFVPQMFGEPLKKATLGANIIVESCQRKRYKQNLMILPPLLMVGVPRLELGTSWSQTRRSSQLSHTPEANSKV